MKLFRWLLIALILCGLPFLMGSGGCSAGDVFAISDSDEVTIGQQGGADIEKQYPVVTGTAEAERVERIGRKIAPMTQRQKLPWSFKVVQMKDVNAFSLPGGPIYVSSALLDLKVTDDELAGVLAHEAAHVNQRHSVKAIQEAMAVGVISEVALSKSSNSTREVAGLAVQLALTLPHSREHEYEADALGVRLATNAGYSPYGLSQFLDRLDKLPNMPKTPEWASDHPATQARVARTKKIADEVVNQPRPVPLTLSANDKAQLDSISKQKTQGTK